MALTIQRLGKEADVPQYIAPENLYINADQSKVVPVDSPDARFLLAAKGHPIPEERARRLGLLDPPVPPEVKAVVPTEDKAVSPAQDKAVTPPATKGQ